MSLGFLGTGHAIDVMNGSNHNSQYSREDVINMIRDAEAFAYPQAVQYMLNEFPKLSVRKKGKFLTQMSRFEDLSPEEFYAHFPPEIRQGLIDSRTE